LQARKIVDIRTKAMNTGVPTAHYSIAWGGEPQAIDSSPY
jgi:hypothetical protein